MSEVPGTGWAEAREPVGTHPITGEWRIIPSPVEHTFTHFVLKLSVERADVGAGVAAPSGHWWAAANGLADEALPSVMKKAIEAACPGATRPSQR
jgi:A/G-specific adenine glycosylase